MAEKRSSAPMASIVLCAGKGRRMNAPRVPKVCFPIAGKPAVAHLLEHLKALGSYPIALVVGHLGGTVVDEVGPRFPGVHFVYQRDLLGTGRAAKQGATLLQSMGFAGGVFVLAGDKVVERHALEKLARVYSEQAPALALLVAPKSYWPNAGRIITDPSGGVVRIIERADLKRGEEEGREVEVGGKSYPAIELETRAEWVNQAIYLFRANALFAALASLDRDNVQGEEYLTDTINWLVRQGERVLPVPVDDPRDVMGFNSPPELLDIEEHLRRKGHIAVEKTGARDPAIFKTPAEWAARLESRDAATAALLRSCYGNHLDLCEEKRRALLRATKLFIERFGGGEPVAIVRAPGRVNLMGRHVDHRGGCVNLMAIDREHILVARPRKDAVVRARNAAPGQFGDIEFSVDDLLRQVRLDDWREFVDSEAVTRLVRDLKGDWGNYLKAPMLRLQQQFKDRHICGVDCVVSGDIPVAAGLSSSSALVVAMAEALVLANRMDVSPHDLVDVCGEGEWFVGTRGGSGDHAAIKLSQFGQVAHVSFFPFAVHGYVDFPPDYALIICDSRIQARKAEGARETFNERIAAYSLATELVRKRFPNHAPLIEHLRDISPERLGIRVADVYRILLDVPLVCSPAQLRKELGAAIFDRIVSATQTQGPCHARGRLLFGIAECARSKCFFDLLKKGDLEQAGWLMNVSHDGDRVVDAQGAPFDASLDDAGVRARIEDLRSEDPERVRAAQLYAQPGGYACSIPEIDEMIGAALATPGVLGAQLAGAGLGGCMMVLTREDAADAVVQRMNERYYSPRGLDPGAAAFVPIAGSCALTME